MWCFVAIFYVRRKRNGLVCCWDVIPSWKRRMQSLATKQRLKQRLERNARYTITWLLRSTLATALKHRGLDDVTPISVHTRSFQVERKENSMASLFDAGVLKICKFHYQSYFISVEHERAVCGIYVEYHLRLILPLVVKKVIVQP
jgi:hypothetical protein